MALKFNRPRDSQRSKVYTAERKLWDDPGEVYRTILEVETFLSRVRQSKWFVDRFGGMTFCIKNGQGCSMAKGWSEGTTVYMRLPAFARKQLIVLHELSHGLVMFECRKAGTTAAGHGPEFCQMYLELVKEFMGESPWTLLRQAFIAHKVKFEDRDSEKARNVERRRFCERVASESYVARAIERLAGVHMELGIFQSLGKDRKHEVRESARDSLERLRQRIDEFLSDENQHG